MNNRKTAFIGIGSFILGAAASAAIAAYLWDIKETQRLVKELNRLTALKEEIETFGEPSGEKVNDFKSGHLDGIAKNLERNDFCNDIDGYGYVARKCAIMIIRKIAECMQDDETLSELTERINFDSVKNYDGLYLL